MALEKKIQEKNEVLRRLSQEKKKVEEQYHEEIKELKDCPEVRGQIKKVEYLLEVLD